MGMKDRQRAEAILAAWVKEFRRKFGAIECLNMMDVALMADREEERAARENEIAVESN